MYSVRILEEAAKEAAEAAPWYEAECPGLGSDFSDALDATLDLVQESILPLLPLTGAAGALRAKRMILKRFPYDIVILERPREILVIAVAHQSRKPGYWRERLNTS